MMKIELYNMSSSNNTVNKVKTKTADLECQIWGSCDVENPSFVLDYNEDVFSSNYLFVPLFNRFYFLNDINILDGTKLVLSCHVDVLDTYWKQIKSMNVNVIRNSENFNLYLNDPLFQITERTHKQVKLCEIPEGCFPFLTTPAPAGHCFVLTSI